jgi:hypothetical protein
MTSTSLSSAATLGRADRSSGLAVSLPSLCCPGPALADSTLAPDPLSLCDGHHPGVAPQAAVEPYPDVHLVESAAVAPVQLRVGGGASKPQIVLESVWSRGATVAADETRNERGAPQHVLDRADVEAGQARVAGRVIEQGTPARCMMLSGVRSMGSNVLKYTRDTSLVDSLYPGPLTPMGHKVQLKRC